MEVLSIIGVLLIIWSLFIRAKLQWTVNKNACNFKEEKRNVLMNKIFFIVIISIGIIMTLVGIINCFM